VGDSQIKRYHKKEKDYNSSTSSYNPHRSLAFSGKAIDLVVATSTRTGIAEVERKNK
jgi:hypothetical protein